MSAFSAVGMAYVSWRSAYARSMVGFPDGHRGAETFITRPTFAAVAVLSALLAVVFVVLAVAPARQASTAGRCRTFVVCVGLAAVTTAIGVIIEPAAKAWYPSVGG